MSPIRSTLRQNFDRVMGLFGVADADLPTPPARGAEAMPDAEAMNQEFPGFAAPELSLSESLWHQDAEGLRSAIRDMALLADRASLSIEATWLRAQAESYGQPVAGLTPPRAYVLDELLAATQTAPIPAREWLQAKLVEGAFGVSHDRRVTPRPAEPPLFAQRVPATRPVPPHRQAR